jgi:hypothetical protein
MTATSNKGDRRATRKTAIGEGVSTDANTAGAAEADAMAADGWPPKPLLPDWIEWAQKASIELEEAAALSLGADPVWDQLLINPPADLSLPRPVPGTKRRVRVRHVQGATSGGRWHHPAMTTEEGRQRLEMLRKHHGSAILPAAPASAGKASVRLADLARFAARQGWEIPSPLASLSSARGASPATRSASGGGQQLRQPKAQERYGEAIRIALERAGGETQPGHESGRADPVKQRAKELLKDDLTESQFDRGWTAYRALLGIKD